MLNRLPYFQFHALSIFNNLFLKTLIYIIVIFNNIYKYEFNKAEIFLLIITNIIFYFF